MLPLLNVVRCRLVANPMYNSRTTLNTWDFSAAAEHQELAEALAEQLLDSDLIPLLAQTAAALYKQWLSINKKLHKAYGVSRCSRFVRTLPQIRSQSRMQDTLGLLVGHLRSSRGSLHPRTV